jgi:hypothetical protein
MNLGEFWSSLTHTAGINQTISSMRVVRLFSAAVALEPVAVAPAKPETVAVYSPSDSLTLPEYCLPATVVLKLVAASTSSAAALLPLAPPDEEEPERDDVVVEMVVLAAEVLATTSVEDEDAVVFDEDAVVDLAVDAGFNTVKLDAPDEIA